MLNPARVRERFELRFGRPCEALARAPGRVNLIGEHVDYNEGFVLPIALPACTWAAAALRPDGRARVFSDSFDAPHEWPLDAHGERSASDWSAYVRGVAWLLRERGARLTGFDLLISSDVPVGSGLSSSAALEVSTALALAHLAGEPLTSAELAELCRTAEREFAGVPCGIMDQYASLMCQRDHALLLDCRSRKIEQIPFQTPGHRLAVIDSGLAHALSDGLYERRVESCQAALRHFQSLAPGVRALRDVSPATARAQLQQIAPPAGIRALHVVTEIERTLGAAGALRAGRLADFGRLMDESHRSLAELYEVSRPEIDDLVARVRRVPGVLGARMTGAGFGGCVIALAGEAAASAIEAVVRDDYAPRHAAALGHAPRVFHVRPSAGAGLVFE